MRASIFSLAAFRLQRQAAAPIGARSWSQQELAELYRVRDRLVQSELRVALEIGLTDEGEPWAVFLQSESGEAFVHIARLNDTIIVANMMANVMYRGEDFRSITDQMLRDAPLVLPAGKAAESKVVMHPRSVFTAFVAAAVVLAEFVRTVEPAKAATDPEKGAQDKSVAETKALFPTIFDRLLARDAGWSPAAVTHGAAASLMTAAVGAVLMMDDHKDDIALVAAARQEFLVAEAAVAPAPDGSGGHADLAASEGVVRVGQLQQTVETADDRLAIAAAQVRADERSAAVETLAETDGRPVAEQAAHGAGAQADASPAATPVKIAASADTEQAVVAPTPPAGQAAHASEAKAANELSLILDSILTVRLPEGANEHAITQAIDKALEAAPHGDEPPAAQPSKTVDAEPPLWILHSSVAEGGPAVMRDGSHDVILLTERDITVYNFRFKEDFLLVDGEIDTTSWIKSIEVHGDDVVIVATNGAVVSLMDTHGLIA